MVQLLWVCLQSIKILCGWYREMISNKTNLRQSEIELLRIMAMIMIIASHMSLHGIIRPGLLLSGNLVNRFLSSFLVLGNVGVGLFFAITGYFSENGKQRKWNQKLFIDILFYSVLTLIFLLSASNFKELQILFGVEEFDRLIRAVLRLLVTPITGENWWFVTAYIYLIIFIVPVLDKIDCQFNQTGRLILICGIFFAQVVSEYMGTPVMRLLQASGYYLVGKYVRYRKERDNLKNRKAKRIVLSLGLLLLLLLHGILMYVSYNSNSGTAYLIVDFFVTILVCPALVAMIFYVFIDKIAWRENKWINLVSETTFGIYLLHDSVYVRKFLWNFLLPMDKIFRSKYFLLYAITIVCCVFTIGSVISFAYIHWVRPYLMKVVDCLKNRVITLSIRKQSV